MFTLQEQPIDITKIKNANPSAGAFVSFEGIVRNDTHNNSQVNALLYIADIPVCKQEGEAILQEATKLFKLTNAVCIQRIGNVPVLETAIWIGAWASHRDEAFKGCRYIIEEIKDRLIIWKKEIYTNGTSAWIHGSETIRL